MSKTGKQMSLSLATLECIKPDLLQKKCAKCSEVKKLTEFYVCKGEVHSYCKTCEKKRRRNRYRTVELERGARNFSKRLRVLELRDETTEGNKVCARCESVKPLSEFYRNSRVKDGHNSYCKSCDSEITKAYHARSPEDRLRLSFNTAKGTARRKGLAFSISVNGLYRLWEQQEGKCYYTGLDMAFDGLGEPTSVSIDRVDSSKGYTVDNVVLCCVFVNRMKNDQPIQELLKWCELIIKRTKGV